MGAHSGPYYLCIKLALNLPRICQQVRAAYQVLLAQGNGGAAYASPRYLKGHILCFSTSSSMLSGEVEAILSILSRVS